MTRWTRETHSKRKSRRQLSVPVLPDIQVHPEEEPSQVVEDIAVPSSKLIPVFCIYPAEEPDGVEVAPVYPTEIDPEHCDMPDIQIVPPSNPIDPTGILSVTCETLSVPQLDIVYPTQIYPTNCGFDDE